MGILLPLVLTLSFPPQVAPIEIGKDSSFKLSFDHDLKDASGSPIVLDRAEFVFRPAPGEALPPDPVRVELVGFSPVAGTNVSPEARDFLGPVPVGQYLASARVRSVSGIWSDESIAILLEVTAKKPSTPTKPAVVGD